MAPIKLVALDLDDTLLRTDLTISSRAKNAIKQAVEKGTLVTLATGRMYASALPYAQGLGLDLPLITYQGALVKYADGRVVHQQPLEMKHAKDLIISLKNYKFQINVYINDELYIEEKSPELQRYAEVCGVPYHVVPNLVDAMKTEPSKVLVIGDAEKLDNLYAKMRGDFRDTVHITKSKSTYLEFSHLLATKGRALRSLASSLGLKADEVMAIGDSQNDLDMIEYAGFGVAMGNAVPQIKDCARYVTCKNDDDGVAEAIEKFVLI